MIVWGLVVLAVVVYTILVVRARPVPSHPFFEHHQDVFVIAHRGGAGLWPENTLYAFEQAMKLGAHALEMDIQSTRNGELVIIHDNTVERTTNGSGRVQDLTLTELQALDAGYRWTADQGQTFPFRGRGITVPTLKEVFTRCHDIAMILEIKQFEPPLVTQLDQLIRDHNMADHVLVAAFDANTINAYRRLNPNTATALSEQEVRTFYIRQMVYLDRLYRPPAQALEVPQYHEGRCIVTPRFIKAAHGRHMAVHVWTVNDINDMEHLIDLGVDGIDTDYPDRLLTLLGRRQ